MSKMRIKEPKHSRGKEEKNHAGEHYAKMPKMKTKKAKAKKTKR